jgi:bifunctional non-homologous end joining protein LigD
MAASRRAPASGRKGIVPMKAITGPLPTDDDNNWGYEIKWDGYRAIAFVDKSTTRYQSTNLLDLTPRWPELGDLARDVHAPSAILDGEVVALDPGGVPRFELLQRGEVPRTYVVFDVLGIDGRNTMGLAYEDRRRLLAELVTPGDHWIVPSHQIGGGEALLEAAREQGLEGIVAKRLGSIYQPGKRTPAWRKVKARREQELVIGGWTRGTGNREGTFGSILVGYYDGDALRYGGAVGTGFDRRLLESLQAEFRRLATDTCAFDPPPPAIVRRTAKWVRPELVCEVAFAEWTFDGVVRQASFLGLRDDKDPREVVREPDATGIG